ncbi:hypothetical protein PI125_g14691 [Phytophthora idaei]|nr:hypothetical protein PI125_g14691 [Phytophthora idaei]
MGGVGPADRLPPVTTMVQQVASQRVVSEPAGYDSSRSTRSVRPRRPWRARDRRAIGVPARRFGAPVGARHPVDAADVAAVIAYAGCNFSAARLSVSFSEPSTAVPSPPVTPAAAVQLPATPRAPAAPSPVVSPRAPSLPAEASESGEENDNEEWEDDDDPDPYTAANLIRASLTVALAA